MECRVCHNNQLLAGIWTERIRQRTAGRVHDGFQSRLWLIAATTYLQLPKCVFQYIDIRRKAIRPQIIFLNIIRNRRGFTDITIGNQPKPKINTSGFQCICKRRKTALDRGNRCSHAACRINQEHDVCRFRDFFIRHNSIHRYERIEAIECRLECIIINLVFQLIDFFLNRRAIDICDSIICRLQRERVHLLQAVLRGIEPAERYIHQRLAVLHVLLILTERAHLHGHPFRNRIFRCAITGAIDFQTARHFLELLAEC